MDPLTLEEPDSSGIETRIYVCEVNCTPVPCKKRYVFIKNVTVTCRRISSQFDECYNVSDECPCPQSREAAFRVPSYISAQVSQKYFLVCVHLRIVVGHWAY
jgi:hypothetical protein